MGTEKKNRNYKEISEGIVVWLIRMFFFVMFFVFMLWGLITPEHNPIILNTSIGLLTFVAIFYFSFVLKTEIEQRRGALLAKKLKEQSDKIDGPLDKISREKDKPHPDPSVFQNESYRLVEVSENISQLGEKTNINRFLKLCVISFIFAIILVVIDYGTNFEISTRAEPLTSTLAGFMAMWCGIYYLARLIMAWNKISEYKA